jgi:hypothetical protein
MLLKCIHYQDMCMVLYGLEKSEESVENISLSYRETEMSIRTHQISCEDTHT